MSRNFWFALHSGESVLNGPLYLGFDPRIGVSRQVPLERGKVHYCGTFDLSNVSDTIEHV